MTTRPKLHVPTRIKSTSVGAPGRLVQRKCACGSMIASGGCERCSSGGTNLLQRSNTSREADAAPSIVYEVLRSPGQPLDPATRAFFERRFGYDFSKVRVHTDTRAAQSARAVDALAYTVGRDMVFAAGQHTSYPSGISLLAHELTHVIQQGTALENDRGKTQMISSQALEAEADRSARDIETGLSRPRP